jgi:23S rRNA (cytidine2498-2'-O)-methyltransferase
LFSDVACYPERLLQLVTRWIESKRCRRIVATIKLQGRWEASQSQGFLAIPGARVVHLFHNKNELTFIWTCQSSSQFA